MSSGDPGKKQESFVEYEKDYLERLQKQQDGQNLQNLIFDFSKDSEKPKESTVDYIGHCIFCMMGVPRAEMTYNNSQLFHSNCFEQQGKNFPAPNEEFLKQNSNTKVQLVLLKNLKFRKMGALNPDNSKPKTKKKSKRKTKKRSAKRRVSKRKRTAKRRKPKKRTSRRKISKKRRITKRRTSAKRKKSTRKTKRRSTRRTKRKTRRRR